MKKIIIILTLLLLLTGCTKSDEEKAIKAAEEYLKTIYDTTDAEDDLDCDVCYLNYEYDAYEALEELMTDQAFAKSQRNRDVSTIYTFTFLSKTVFEVNDLELTLSENSEDSYIFYYTISVDFNDGEEIIEDIKGQIALSKVDGKWLVNGDTKPLQTVLVQKIFSSQSN